MTDLPDNDKRSIELRYRAHKDLSRRGRGGIVIYLLSWLVITLPFNVQSAYSDFFYFNTVVLLLITAARIYHLLILPSETAAEVNFARVWLIVFVLLGAGHWGVLTAWVLLQPDLSHLGFNMVATAAVLGIAGATTLSIAPELRRCFPMLILIPTSLALMWRGTTADLILAIMAFIALGYVYLAAKTASDDYWRAQTNHLIAEDRAHEMETLSITDPLTQLKNRGYFDRRFREEWKRSERQQSPLSVLMMDLDKFKRLNDTYGHAFGDEVLREVSASLKQEVFRDSDMVARYGGEEFVVLLPDTEAEPARHIAERIRLAIEGLPFEHLGRTVPVTCSLGGATVVPHRDIDAESLLKRADEALYESKNAGRNRYTAASE